MPPSYYWRDTLLVLHVYLSSSPLCIDLYGCVSTRDHALYVCTLCACFLLDKHNTVYACILLPLHQRIFALLCKMGVNSYVCTCVFGALIFCYLAICCVVLLARQSDTFPSRETEREREREREGLIVHCESVWVVAQWLHMNLP